MEQAKESENLRSHSLKWGVMIAAGLLLLGWLFNTPDGLLGKADAIGYAVCHRIELRSFHLGDRQLPLCARCSGMYLGAVLGLVYFSLKGPRRSEMPPKRLWPALALLVAAFGVDGLNSYLHLFPGFTGLYEPQNWSRLLTGTGMGLAVIAVLYPSFTQTVWQTLDKRPVLDGYRSLGVLLLLALLLDLLVLTGNPMILYPLALISAAGVMVLLIMVYSMGWVMVFRLENRFSSLASFILPLTGGFGMAVLQIIVLDVLRYVFTGSWDGFHLG